MAAKLAAKEVAAAAKLATKLTAAATKLSAKEEAAADKIAAKLAAKEAKIAAAATASTTSSSAEESDDDRGTKKSAGVLKCPTPWSGVADATKCSALKLNHGLYTQCCNGPNSGEFCTACTKTCNAEGVPSKGTVAQRIAVGTGIYTTPDGKKTSCSYGDAILKMKIPTATAVSQLAEMGTVLPAAEYELTVAAGKKAPAVKTFADDDESDEAIFARGMMTIGSIDGVEVNAFDILAELQSQARIRTKADELAAAEADEDTVVVSEWKYHGKVYLRSDDDQVFEFDTHDPIGTVDSDGVLMLQ